jgi:hypothetical protein
VGVDELRYQDPQESDKGAYQGRVSGYCPPDSGRDDLVAILAVDLLVMFYGGYLSSRRLLTQPSGIFWAVVGLIAAIGTIESTLLLNDQPEEAGASSGSTRFR